MKGRIDQGLVLALPSASSVHCDWETGPIDRALEH